MYMYIEFIQRVAYNNYKFYNKITESLKGCLDGSAVKESACNTGDTGDVGSIPGLRRSPGEGICNPLQYFRLGNPIDRKARWATVHGVAQSQT